MKYETLLSPVCVGNLVLKNRLISGNSLPHFLQGPEAFPAEPVINHVVTMAKNGAAVVTFADWTNMGQRESVNEDGKRFPMFTLDSDPSVENYICQLADQVHYYNSKISLAIMPFAAPDLRYDVSDTPAMDMKEAVALMQGCRFGEKVYDRYGMDVAMRGGAAAKAMPKEMIQDVIEACAQRALKYKKLGFDMCTLHFAYRATLFSRFLSPQTNTRTDEYGGSPENRARFMKELAARIKELCGAGFPVEVQITGSEHGENAQTIEDTIRMAKEVEDVVDIFQFRADTANVNHPTGYNSRNRVYAVLDDCAAVKASGTKILCETMGGFLDPDDMEDILRTGKADLIGGARTFIRDFDFYQKLKEGRGEDITPCIRCNKCHVPSLEGEWLSYCSVNPRMGINHRLDKLTTPFATAKKVAVVGGGPAGMRAALLLTERGHEVTLYEASDALGGQLKLMDGPSFKWPLVEYREWLKRELDKYGVRVLLNTRADKALLAAEGFEAIVLALGAQPKTPPIPGAEKAYSIFTVLGHEKELGHRVVVVGGSESGTEAGLYLAENGHRVTILTRGASLATDATPIHYRETIDEYFRDTEGIDYVEFAVTTEIGDGFVTYTDKDGREQRIDCDDVVALGGMASQKEEAMAMFGLTPETYMIGDCLQVGNLHTGVRGAFSVAYNL